MLISKRQNRLVVRPSSSLGNHTTPLKATPLKATPLKAQFVITMNYCLERKL
jgi:hypothetical protein